MGAQRGPLALVAADGAAPVSPGAALLEEMLAGWRRQQQARRLTMRLVGERERVVRQFAAFTGCWPWQWTAAQAEVWVASGGWAHSTVRSYEGALALFLEYVCDPRYGWVSECEQRAGAVPVQVFHERNTAVHVSEHEGRAERRPLTRAELQAFFDAADDHVEKAAGSRRKGWLAGFRDATLFKVVYGRGAAPPGGGDAGRGRFRAESGGSGAGRAGSVPCPVRQGDAGQPAAPPGCGYRDAVGRRGAGPVP
jgi:integrase/recombinase XerC